MTPDVHPTVKPDRDRTAHASVRADVRTATRRPDHADIRVHAPVVYAGALAAGFLLQWLFPVSIAHEEGRTLFRFIGAGLIVLGLTLGGSAVGLFRAAGTSPVPFRPTTALVLDGPYHFTRNPMYLGMLLIYSGIMLITNAAWPLVFVPVIVAVITRNVIVPEEKYLSRKFGGEYEVYRRQTHRWI